MSATAPNQPGLAHGLISPTNLRSTVHCGIFLWCDGKLKELTPGAGARYLGAGSEVAEGKLCPAVRAVLEAEPGCGRELLIPNPDGPSLHLSACTVRIDNAIVMVVHDALAARQMDGNLEHLDRLASLGAMSAGMAHEIKNALVAGRTFIDLLLEKEPGVELAHVVRRELKRIETMVGQMLRHARPSPSMAAPFDVHDTVAQALQLVQPQVEERAVQLKTDLMATKHHVHGNAFQFQQALLNLLLNAVEVSPEQGSIAVETGNATDGSSDILVSVQDNGPGISAEAMRNLFRPFYTTKPNGTGLGLVITQRITEEHGGSIRVQSEHRRGARFTLRLPVCGDK